MNMCYKNMSLKNGSEEGWTDYGSNVYKVIFISINAR